jgi:serine/threonine-protein kinase
VPSSAGLPQVPGYEVEAVLGRGGMGVVFKARHLALKRTVALKMIAGHSDPTDRGRFKVEAEAVARLQHPNIVQIHEIGEAGGLPYFALEFVEGGSLANRLAGRPLPPRDAACLVMALADAMHLAHSRNLVHRDLKPANVLLTGGADTPIGQCQPKVTDFGLARQLDADSGQTRVGAIMGTPSYMAPEQAEGRAHAAGPAADVYALGAILYECLTARPPFKGPTPLDTLEQVRTREPAAPSSLNRQAPRDLETICLKCLRKQPERRYASARELAEDLHCFLEGKPVRARPVGAAERAVKWARRRPAAALLLAAFLVLVGAATGTGLWLRQQQAAQAQREDEARKAIETALTRADDCRHKERWREALLVLTEASTHLPEARSPLLQERLRQAQSDLRFAADLEGVRLNSSLETDGSRYYKPRAAEFQEAFERGGLRIGDDAESVADYIRASLIREQLVAAIDDWALAAFMLNDDPLVQRLLRIARLADPEPRWRNRFRDRASWWKQEKLLQLAANAFNTSPPPSGHQLALLGLLLRRTGARSQSTRLLDEACRRQPDNFWLNREMGFALLLEGRNLEAAGYYRAAIALRPDNAGAYGGLGTALYRANQMDDALAAFRRVVELSPASRASGYLVRPLANTGHWVEAAAECRRALEAYPTDPRPPLCLARVLCHHQRDEDAIVLSRKAIAVGTKDSTAYLYLGLACIRTNRHEEAVTALRQATESLMDVEAPQLLARELKAVGRPGEAIAVLQARVARGLPSVALYEELGAILRTQGRPEEATAAFRKATNLDPRSPAAWDGLAAALLDRGRFAEARAATQRLLDLPATAAAHRARRRQLALCVTLLSVAADLPAILAGKERPTKVATQRALAEWCLKHKRLPATAASFYDTALSAQPSLVNDLEVGNRFHAACAAARAGCGLGKDAATRDDQRRAVLRKQALDWLTAEYNAWAARHLHGKPGDRTVVATAVRSWQQNKDLAGVRDEQALARLPLEERRAWKTLWANVTTLAARDPVALFNRARAHIARRQWKKAAKCFAQGFELEPATDGDSCFEYAATQLLSRNRPGYRRTCAHILARCQMTPPMRPYLAARACTLAPDSAEDPARPARLSQNELMQSGTAFWALTERAALQVRAGRPRDALPLLERSLTADGRPGRSVLNWLWLALAYQKLGKAAEAQRWLDRAAGWLDQQGDRMPLDTPITGLHRHNWLEAQVLLAEAKRLLR